MAEPFCYRIHEVGDMTDEMIRRLFDAQERMIEAAKSSEAPTPKAFDEPPATKIGSGDFVTKEEAEAFMSAVESDIYR